MERREPEGSGPMEWSGAGQPFTPETVNEMDSGGGETRAGSSVGWERGLDLTATKPSPSANVLAKVVR